MEVEAGEARERTTEFLTGYVEDVGVDGVVLGLSGGIDSATAAAVAVDALGSDSVYGLVLPVGSSDNENMRDAREHAEQLDIEFDTLDISGVVEEAVDLTGVTDREAVGNLKARVRMCVNYLYANERSRLVLGTGNRSEILLGYFTKYGDGGVDVSPLGGLYKTEVRELAREIDVPEKLVTKTPTAGLWEGQTDEDELGAPYDVVDVVLEEAVDRGNTVEEAADAAGCTVDVAENLLALVKRSEHKRRTPPYPDFGRS